MVVHMSCQVLPLASCGWLHFCSHVIWLPLLLKRGFMRCPVHLGAAGTGTKLVSENQVMTGVFCNSAIKAAERDHEMVIHSLLQSRKEFKDLVSNLFQKIDDLGLGMITISEFERHFNDDSVRAFFESLEMGAVDAWTLFASLDADGDNVISLNDFTERCIQLHGPARSVDLYALTQQNATWFYVRHVLL